MKRLSLALVYALLITGISIGYALQSVMAAHESTAAERLTSTYRQQASRPQDTLVSNPRS
jgi:multisubunit Na+/H+ antiporter MnhC subunit